MTDFELVTAADVQLMGLAQRVSAAHPKPVGAGVSYGELT
jgi:hypothetical protein